MCPQQRCSAHIRALAAVDQEPNNPFETSTKSGIERSPSEMTKAHEHAVMGGT